MGLIHIACACAGLLQKPWTGHYGNATGCHGETSTCAHNVYQALSPLNLKGLGTRLGMHKCMKITDCYVRLDFALELRIIINFMFQEGLYYFAKFEVLTFTKIR